MKKLAKSTLCFLASNAFFRNHSPFLDNWHQVFNLGDKSKLNEIGTTYANLKHTVFFWRWAPRKFSGGAIANILGLQILRYYFYNFRYLARTRGGRFATAVANSGITVCPQILDPEMVNELLSFYYNHTVDTLHHFGDFSELILCNTKGPAKPGSEYARITDRLTKTYHITDIGEDLTGQKLNLFPFISIIHYKSDVDRPDQCDGQNIPHADVFYPSFKLFVYLNEVDENNGAFRYFKGSHRFSLNHAANAYNDSFQYYFKGGRRQLYPTDATRRLDESAYEWISVSGKPGDGFIFNVQGIHRRGDFLKDQYRERLVLLVDFRQAEVPVHRLAANV